ncbi:hypothetical protein RN001_014753 [Aquatica leii]|uniref:Uncharacterized protein n=1 Tax=Aquatica leii TaxID=1421715 RepID=A0AAN7NYE5_9COLE|nr:hypothetical protein RN001_014753 [Aquatica leii]
MLSLLQDPFHLQKTEYKRLQFFEKSKKFILPEKQFLGIREDKKRKDNQVSMILKKSYSYFIPMQKTLKLFLELPGVLNKILEYQRKLSLCDEDIMCNVTHGTLWKGIEEKSNSEIILPIVMYFDDFEVLNPLGSQAGCYKIGAVYYYIATIPPTHISKLENIFLCLLFYANDRVEFGNEKIFNVLVNELKFLENEGISVNLTDGSNRKIKFSVITITGDNAGLNSILGYNESFSSTYYCRICTSSKDINRIQTLEKEDTIRLKINYTADLCSKKGLKEKCVWNGLSNFHVYDNIFCDVMHDLFEGVHRYDMALIINKLIEKKYFTSDILNSRMKYFTYNNNEKNVAPGFSPEQLLKNIIVISAYEMLCLVRNFRFIIGDCVPKDDTTWHFYLLIYEITEILTSHSLRKTSLEYLQILVEEHHSLYLDLSGSNLKPKYHFLTHYVRIILKLGPLMTLSCLRPEGKHQELKNESKITKCRKNIPRTLSLKNQLKQCYRFMSLKGLEDKINFGKMKNIDLNNYKQCNHTLSLENFKSTSFYEINSCKYEKHTVILLDYNNDSPIFCELIDILIHHIDFSNIYFLCSIWYSEIFNNHYKAYKIKKSNTTKLFSKRIFENDAPGIIYRVSENEFYASIN